MAARLEASIPSLAVVGSRLATLTTEANPELALIQERMPVIIERADWPVWLGEVEGDPQTLIHHPPADRFRV